MSPFRWSRQHQIALALCMVIGGIAGAILGYFVYHIQEGEVADDFGTWLFMPFQFNLIGTAFYNLASIEWFGFGCLIGAAAMYAGRLTRNSN
jgi:hypothetical protein